MTTQDRSKTAVVGAGMMGVGIGIDFARAGYDVAMFNRTAESSRQAESRAAKALDRMATTDLISAEASEETKARLSFTTDLADAVCGAFYVVESVTEQLSLKQEIFRDLDALCPPPAILATNTSTIKPTTIAAAVVHPERVLVTHYFHPPHLLPLVEIVGGEKTSQEIIDRVYQVLIKLRKKPVVLLKETASFAGNRIQGGISAEASWLVENGVCSPETVDTVITMGLGRRMGILGYFNRIDLGGLDLRADIYRAKGEKIPEYFQAYLDRGELGVKTGKGFYKWAPEAVENLKDRLEMELIRQLKLDYESGRL